MASYVGIDLHRRRSVIVVMDDAGEVVSSTRIENSRSNLECERRRSSRLPVVNRSGGDRGCVGLVLGRRWSSWSGRTCIWLTAWG